MDSLEKGKIACKLARVVECVIVEVATVCEMESPLQQSQQRFGVLLPPGSTHREAKMGDNEGRVCL